MNLVTKYKNDDEYYTIYEISYDEKRLDKLEQKYSEKKYKPLFRAIRKDLLCQVFADENKQDSEESVYLKVNRDLLSYCKKLLKSEGMEVEDVTEVVSANWSKEYKKNLKKSKRIIIGLAVAGRKRRKKRD